MFKRTQNSLDNWLSNSYLMFIWTTLSSTSSPLGLLSVGNCLPRWVDQSRPYLNKFINTARLAVNTPSLCPCAIVQPHLGWFIIFRFWCFREKYSTFLSQEIWCKEFLFSLSFYSFYSHQGLKVIVFEIAFAWLMQNFDCNKKLLFHCQKLQFFSNPTFWQSQTDKSMFLVLSGTHFCVLVEYVFSKTDY